MAILQNTDFSKGRFSIPTDNYSDLPLYITKYEREILLQLFGASLYDLFVADLTGSPQAPSSPIYQALFEEFHFDEGGSIIESQGIKEMLIRFVYFYYMRDIVIQKSVTGFSFNNSETTANSPWKGTNLEEAYNEAVDIATAIQYKIQLNESDYPDFNGKVFSYISGI